MEVNPIPVNVTVLERDLLVERAPELRLEGVVRITNDRYQLALDRINHPLHTNTKDASSENEQQNKNHHKQK